MPDSGHRPAGFNVFKLFRSEVSHFNSAITLNPVITFFHIRPHPALVTEQYMHWTMPQALEILHVELSRKLVASPFKHSTLNSACSPYCCESSLNEGNKKARLSEPYKFDVLINYRQKMAKQMKEHHFYMQDTKIEGLFFRPPLPGHQSLLTDKTHDTQSVLSIQGMTYGGLPQASRSKNVAKV